MKKILVYFLLLAAFVAGAFTQKQFPLAENISAQTQIDAAKIKALIAKHTASAPDVAPTPAAPATPAPATFTPVAPAPTSN